MSRKNEEDVALELYQSVVESSDKQRRLKSTTFWSLFDVGARRKTVIERIEHLLSGQGLRVTVKSGKALGEEHDDDWIIVALALPQPPEKQPIISETLIKSPTTEWFIEIKTRSFESEREVETYFVAPLLEKLGYEYDNIVIGYPVEMFRGGQRTRTEADFAVFKGSSREKEDTLLIIETKKSDKNITADHISQARSYAQELLPACYCVTNGSQIIVYWFNGMLAPDERVIDFDRAMLDEKWDELYRYASKEATVMRKSWMKSQVQSKSEVK